MMKVKTSKGFTLAELLIVMAIIVVLAAIAIPTFGKQLETARESADAEAIRAAATNAFSEAYTAYVTGKYDGTELAGATFSGDSITLKQTTPSAKKAFEYIQPSITIGRGTVTLSGDAELKDGPIVFKFAEDTTSGSGILIASIQVGTNGTAVTAVS